MHAQRDDVFNAQARWKLSTERLPGLRRMRMQLRFLRSVLGVLLWLCLLQR